MNRKFISSGAFAAVVAISCINMEASPYDRPDSVQRDSVTITGSISHLMDSAHGRVQFSLLLPPNYTQQNVTDYTFNTRGAMLDAERQFTIKAPLDRQVTALLSCSPSNKKGWGSYIVLHPGDSIHIDMRANDLGPYRIYRNGQTDSLNLRPINVMMKRSMLGAPTDGISAQQYAEAADSVYRRYAKGQGLETEKDRQFNATLSSLLLAYCSSYDAEHSALYRKQGGHDSDLSRNSFVKERRASLLDGDSLSALSTALKLLPTDDASIGGNIDYFIACRQATQVLHDNIDYKSASRKERLSELLDTIVRVCTNETDGKLSVFGQNMLICALEYYAEASSQDMELIRQNKYHLFTSDNLRHEWDKAIQSLDIPITDRTSHPALLTDKKISAIRKAHRSKYIEFVFFRNAPSTSSRLFLLDNLRRDFRKSKDLAIVYCGVADTPSDLAAMEAYQKRYPEEHFVIFSEAEYVNIINILQTNLPLTEMTMDRKGMVLDKPLRFEDSEFSFRYTLRKLLEENKSR